MSKRQCTRPSFRWWLLDSSMDFAPFKKWIGSICFFESMHDLSSSSPNKKRFTSQNSSFQLKKIGAKIACFLNGHDWQGLEPLLFASIYHAVLWICAQTFPAFIFWECFVCCLLWSVGHVTVKVVGAVVWKNHFLFLPGDKSLHKNVDWETANFSASVTNT